ncbi:hypothetical protein ACOME3_001624 [Neoechinorhynchus agilis]
MFYNKLSVRHLDLEGKRVLVRVDFNIPLDNKQQPTDEARIDSIIPTILLIKSKKPRYIILISHLGNPVGRDLTLSLFPATRLLAFKLKERIRFINDCRGSCVIRNVNESPNGKIIVLENLRFRLEEEASEFDANGSPNNRVKKFRRFLSSLCDIFVNDAFGVCHRLHSSIVGIDVPLRATGVSMERELEYLEALTDKPSRPFLAIIGGAKVEDKIKLLYNLVEKVDVIILAGGLAFTFLRVLTNMNIGSSLFDEKGAAEVDRIMKRANEREVKIHLPIDFVCLSTGRVVVVDEDDGISDGFTAMDIGPNSVDTFRDVMGEAKTVFWNGPVGVYEDLRFSHGTKHLLKSMAEATKDGVLTVIGGGDTAAAAAAFGFTSTLSHVSAGGGATLELLQGTELPGISILTDAVNLEHKSGSVPVKPTLKAHAK